MRQWTRITAVGIAAVPLLGSAAAQDEPPYIEVTKLLASDGGFGDHFGDTLAIDGDTLVVGGDDIGSGGAYVFERNEGGSNAWREVVKLVAPDEAEDFGRFVDMQGDLVAVGANDVEAVGSVYLFERDAGRPVGWGLTAKLLAPDGLQEGRIFATPAIDGDRLLVGALGDEQAGFFAGGAAYIFVRDDSVPKGWRFEEKVLPSDPAITARFGEDLDVDGDTFVVGAHNLEVDDISGAGAAYVFELVDGMWVEIRKLTAELPESDGNFGEAVAIQGDTIAVGHPGEDGNNGALYLYGRDLGGPGEWGLEQKVVPDGPGGLFGVAVGIDGGTLVVGADITDSQTVENTGSIYVFERSTASGWTQVAHLEASDLPESQRFGTAVGISGGTLLAGADQDDQSGSSAGAAYVFQVVARPRIDVTGSCPGEVTLELSGATPWGSVVVAHADSEGATIVPAGECDAVELDLEDADLLGRFLAGEDGGGERNDPRTRRTQGQGERAPAPIGIGASA